MADMVPDEIKSAECIGRAADDLTGEGVLPQIAGKCDRLAACIRNLLHHRIGAGFIQIHHADRCALLRKPEGACSSHARRCRSDALVGSIAKAR